MAVVVTPVETHISPQTYEEGASWHVDELGFLHVRDGERKHIATFATRQWANVELSAG